MEPKSTVKQQYEKKELLRVKLLQSLIESISVEPKDISFTNTVGKSYPIEYGGLRLGLVPLFYI